MKKPIAFIVGILSLFSLGQQLLIKTGFVLSTVGSMVLVPEKIYAENEDFYTTWENKKEESVDHYGVTLKNIRKLQESQLNDFYDAISEFDYKKKMEIYEGISKYTKAIEFNQNNETAYYNRGILRRKLGDYYGAISDYTKAIEINPKFVFAYNNRGFAKGKLKDYDGAISDFTKAIEINPKYARGYNNRGWNKAKLKDHYGAISDYTKAIEINPKYANALANRGSSKKSIGDMQGACDDWIKASSLGHEDATQSVRKQC